MKTKTPAVTYLRVSGRGQVHGDGFPRQRAAIAHYATSAGFDLVGEFTDAGVSGTTDWDAREGLGALLDRVASNGVRVVLVERADRLARDLMVSEVLLKEFQKLGVRVLDATGTDLTAGNDADPTTVLIRQVLGAVAQFDKNVLVLKLRAARVRARAKRGRCEGRKPYGTRPGEADVVARIRALRRKPKKGDRLSMAAIASQLNADGVPTRTGTPWAPGTVFGICRRLGVA